MGRRSIGRVPEPYPLPGMSLVVAMLVIAAVAFAGVGVYGSSARRPVAVLASMPLFGDDDGGSAMFALPAMAPGVPVARCIEIDYSGGWDAGDVRLAASDLSGALVDDLAVRVETGTGGTFADCAGFTGGEVYSGTLRGLSTPDGAGVDTGWQPTGDETRTFRITVTLTAPAQPAPGSTADATFVWRVPSVEPPPPPTTPVTASPSVTAMPTATATPSASATPTATATPTPTATATATASATPAATAAPTATPAPTSTTTPPTAPTDPTTEPAGPVEPGTPVETSSPAGAQVPAVPPSPRAPTTSPRPPAAVTSAATSAPAPAPATTSAPGGSAASPAGVPARPDRARPSRAQAVVNALARVAKEFGARPAIPLALILALIVFLALQHLLDGRDPKLALAPVWRSNYVWIPTSSETEE